MQLASLDTAVVATFVVKTNQPPSDSKNKMDLRDSTLIKELMDDIPSSDGHSGQSDDDEPATKSPPKLRNGSIHCDSQSTAQNGARSEAAEEHKSGAAASPTPESQPIVFTQEDIESIPNIEQKAQCQDDAFCGVSVDNLWCPRLGYRPYDDGIWRQFLEGDGLFINERLKVIPRIVEGGWYFTFPQRPALLGMKTPQRCYRGRNYLEVDCEADNNYIAAQITKAAYHISTYLVVDIMLTLEGRQRKELPERCLGGFTLKYVDTTKAVTLNDDDHDDDDNDGDEDHGGDEDSEREQFQQSMEHNHDTL